MEAIDRALPPDIWEAIEEEGASLITTIERAMGTSRIVEDNITAATGIMADMEVDTTTIGTITTTVVVLITIIRETITGITEMDMDKDIIMTVDISISNKGVDTMEINYPKVRIFTKG